MEVLRQNDSIKSVDLREALGVAPSTFNELLKKHEIQYLPVKNNKGRGAARAIESVEVRKLMEARGFKYPKPAQIISFLMCKGGVGKTTSTFYVSQRMASYGARVLVIDADPQGNLTGAFNLGTYGIEIDEETTVMADILEEKAKPQEAIIAVSPNLHLLPSSPINSNVDSIIERQYPNISITLKTIIDPVADQYDYILIDSAPAINKTFAGIVCASDLLILPVAPDKFSEMGLGQTLEQVERIAKQFGVSASPRLVFTKYDAREFTSMKYLAEIAEKHSEIMFETAIRTASDVKNAISRKENLYSYKNSNAKEDYDKLTKEIMGISHLFAPKKSKESMEG